MAGETPCPSYCRWRFGVSIRSRHRWREKRRHLRAIDSHRSFNPLPPSMAGETTVCGAFWYLPSFNPLPPSMAGETTAFSLLSSASMVSIRSRHRWREKRPGEGEAHEDGCFNPLPPSMAGETTALRRKLGLMKFQSAPAIDGGRNQRDRRQQHGNLSFNPLPPSMAGETRHHIMSPSDTSFQSAPAIDGGRNEPADLQVWGGPIVSIRSRHRWREKQSTPARIGVRNQFQSAPAIDGGRNTFSWCC